MPLRPDPNRDLRESGDGGIELGELKEPKVKVL